MNHNELNSRIYFWTFITVMKICTDCGAFSTLYSKAISLSQVTSLCHTIEWYYLRNKVFWCGLGWSWEYILWLSQFDNIVMAYPLTSGGYSLHEMIYNSGMCFMLYKENTRNSVCIRKNCTHMSQIPVTFHSYMLLSVQLKCHKLISQKTLYVLSQPANYYSVIGDTLLCVHALGNLEKLLIP